MGEIDLRIEGLTSQTSAEDDSADTLPVRQAGSPITRVGCPPWLQQRSRTYWQWQPYGEGAPFSNAIAVRHNGTAMQGHQFFDYRETKAGSGPALI
jgi:hypothetical protein